MSQVGGTTGRASRRTQRSTRLSVTWVFFLVISAASPITSLLGAVPIGFVSGNGVGLPAAFALVTLILVCFAVGYAAITRRVINTGAYYTYIAQGIGRPPAVGAALLAVLAYTVNLVGIAGASGYFLHVIAADLGADVSWIWGTVPMLLLVGFVGYRSVHVSAKLIGTIMVLGFLALFVYDIAVLASKGLAAFPLESFSPQAMFGHSPGLAVAIALTCFVGVDTAALYSEETDEPERTVPRATYIAVASMGVFYVLSIWLIVGSIGADQIVAKATENPGELVFNDILAVGGDGLQTVTALLFLAASFAGILAFHNAASRYLFVLGRDRVLSTRLGQLHARHRSPFRASLVVSAGSGLLIAIAIAFRLDPYVVLAQGALGLATLGIVTLQALAAVAIVAFFRRRGQGRYWKTLILPGIGAVGLFGIATFVLFNFDDLLGISNPLVNGLPWVIVVVMLVGAVVGLQLRRVSPSRYARLAQSRLRPQARRLARPRTWTRRYALIGAGPAGLVMGRRLAEEGVPFDWFEAGTDVGGLWNADRPGSRVYESLTTVTSRQVSGFPDFPMPADYPDYPQWWQVRDYLRQYAEFHGLYHRIAFRLAATWAKPEGAGWSVTLTNGRFQYYSGIIAASGSSSLPSMPHLPGQEQFRGQLWHSAQYKSARDLRGRRVLVIGAGNSAADIASEAVRAGANTFLSVRHGRRMRPRYVAGVPTDALLAGVVQTTDEALADAEPRDLIAAAVGDVRRLGLPLPETVRSGHPTVSDDLLSLLAQGYIQARGEVVQVFPDGVAFADGTAERIDVIIACTGYGIEVPFLSPDLYTRDGTPDLFLNIFSRSHEGLALLGLSTLGGPVFPSLDDQARAVMVALTLRELGGIEWRAWQSALATHPDLRGGAQFLDTPANALTVDDHTYATRLRDLCDRFGYTPGGEWAGNAVEMIPAPRVGAEMPANTQ